MDYGKTLDCGGADVASNMRWRTIVDGKAKDKWERIEASVAEMPFRNHRRLAQRGGI